MTVAVACIKTMIAFHYNTTTASPSPRRDLSTRPNEHVCIRILNKQRTIDREEIIDAWTTVYEICQCAVGEISSVLPVAYTDVQHQLLTVVKVADVGFTLP